MHSLVPFNLRTQAALDWSSGCFMTCPIACLQAKSTAVAPALTRRWSVATLTLAWASPALPRTSTLPGPPLVPRPVAPPPRPASAPLEQVSSAPQARRLANLQTLLPKQKGHDKPCRDFLPMRWHRPIMLVPHIYAHSCTPLDCRLCALWHQVHRHHHTVLPTGLLCGRQVLRRHSRLRFQWRHLPGVLPR